MGLNACKRKSFEIVYLCESECNYYHTMENIKVTEELKFCTKRFLLVICRFSEDNSFTFL